MISGTCPYCNVGLSIEDECWGGYIVCSSCKEVIEIEFDETYDEYTFEEYHYWYFKKTNYDLDGEDYFESKIDE